jgi:hypothetical protein
MNKKPSDNPSTASIVPAENGLYVVIMRGSIKTYSSFADFVDRLDTVLDGKNTAKRMLASGSYNKTTHTLTANYLTIEIR